MEKFKTVEEAQAAYDKLIEENKVLMEEKAALENQVKSETNRAEEAEKVALELGSKVGNLEKHEDVVVTIKQKKYKINFGVDGLTKEELKKDKELLERLVTIQSGALTLMD